MSNRVTLELTVRGSEEKREDRWVLRSQEFGFTVYGKTPEEANQAFVDAMTALINSFDDPSLLRDYLDKKGVQHRFAREALDDRERDTERFFERRLEVTIGAAA